MAGAGAQSYNSAGAGDEKPDFAQHYYAPESQAAGSIPVRGSIVAFFETAAG